MEMPLAVRYTAEPKPVASSPWSTLAVAALAVFIVSLDTTVLFVAMPDIRRTFASVSASQLSWVLNAYTIGYGALLIPAGRLADRYGRRRFFVGGVAAFVVASLACAFAPNVTALVAARAAQAVGAAALVPASLALVLTAFPLERRGVVLGIWGAVGAVASALGPAIGSVVVDGFGWRWAFLINLPIGALAAVLGARRLGESHGRDDTPSGDLGGTVLLVAALAALAYGVIGVRAGSLAPVLGISGAAALVAFVVRTLRRASPAVDLRLLLDRRRGSANAITFAFGLGFAAMFFENVFFLTSRWHLSILRAGLFLSPGPLVVVPVAITAGRLASRVGLRPLLVLGGSSFAAGGVWLASIAPLPLDFLRLWLPGSVLLGAGIGLVMPSLSAGAVAGLPAERLATASGINQAIRQLGSVLGVALAVVLLGELDEHAHFARGYLLLVLSGVATAVGGATLSRAPGAPAAK